MNAEQFLKKLKKRASSSEEVSFLENQISENNSLFEKNYKSDREIVKRITSRICSNQTNNYQEGTEMPEALLIHNRKIFMS